MPLYGTLSLFRTSIAGCYAFPCISLGCNVSTCKPYAVDTVGVDLFVIYCGRLCDLPPMSGHSLDGHALRGA